MLRSKQPPENQLIKLLGKIPFFSSFSVSDRLQFLDHAKLYIAESGEPIIEKGARDTCCYILLSGRANVGLSWPVDSILAELEPGDLFGELSFVLNTPRLSWVVAEQRCAVLRIDQQLLNDLDANVRDKIKDQIILKLAKTIDNQNNRNS